MGVKRTTDDQPPRIDVAQHRQTDHQRQQRKRQPKRDLHDEVLHRDDDECRALDIHGRVRPLDDVLLDGLVVLEQLEELGEEISLEGVEAAESIDDVEERLDETHEYVGVEHDGYVCGEQGGSTMVGVSERRLEGLWYFIIFIFQTRVKNKIIRKTFRIKILKCNFCWRIKEVVEARLIRHQCR